MLPAPSIPTGVCSVGIKIFFEVSEGAREDCSEIAESSFDMFSSDLFEMVFRT